MTDGSVSNELEHLAQLKRQIFPAGVEERELHMREH